MQPLLRTTLPTPPEEKGPQCLFPSLLPCVRCAAFRALVERSRGGPGWKGSYHRGPHGTISCAKCPALICRLTYFAELFL